ncbi:MAG: ATP-binding protein [Nanoarchaeota archaeon]
MNKKIMEILESQNPWWFNENFDIGINRLNFFNNIIKYINLQEILFLIGVRRTGKSTLMYQLINYLLNKNVKSKEILFINFDEPFLKSNVNNSQLLIEIIENYLILNKDINKLYVFLDEIQVYPYWSESLKYLYDVKKNIKIIASGSSSNLIESKLAIKLSGRYFYENIYPLSFGEYLNFNNLNKIKSIEYKYYFDKYLLEGGFPRVVLEKDDKIKIELLKNYFQTIYLKDIIIPNNLRNNQEVYNLLYYLLSNVSKLYSYNSLVKVLNISVDTIKEYISFANKSYFIFNLSMYSDSVKKQLVNPKKIYSVDTGLANSISFRFSEDKGRLLENLVFIELKRREKEVYYHRGKKECDFVIKEGLDIVQAIQVTKSLESEELGDEIKKREIDGLLDACKTYNLNEGLILTQDEEGEETREVKLKNGEKKEVKIIVKPIWKWLLELKG